MMQTELIENNPHLAESFTAPQAVQSVPYATPVTPPPILQSQQPINHPVGPPPVLNIPYQSNAAPNASIARSNCCANCSESRQTGNPPPPVNAPRPPLAILHPAAGNPSAPQIPNGPGPYPMQSRMVNNPTPLPPMALPPMPQRQHVEQMWNNVPHESVNQVLMGPAMQRPGPSAVGSFIPMIPNIGGFEMLDLNQRPMNQGPQPRYPGTNGPIPFGHGLPPPMPVRNPYEIQRPNASNGRLPSESMIPHSINQPFQARIVPPRPPPSAYANYPPPPSRPREDLDLATQLGYLSINLENDNNTFSSKLTSKYLQETYNDLNGLARQISPATAPFDTTGTVLSQVVGRLNLPHPSEWRLSIRCHSCKRSFVLTWLIILVLNGNTTMNETVLTQEDFPLYDYNKCFRMNKYPLFVLTYVGGRGNEIQKPEITFGLNNVEQEIQAMKAKMIKEKS